MSKLTPIAKGNRPKMVVRDVSRIGLSLCLHACKQRLRPILLTSLTTIFGLLPLAMGVSLDIIARDIALGSSQGQYLLR